MPNIIELGVWINDGYSDSRNLIAGGLTYFEGD
jgi:hypothetical protein